MAGVSSADSGMRTYAPVPGVFDRSMAVVPGGGRSVVLPEPVRQDRKHSGNKEATVLPLGVDDINKARMRG